MSAAPLTTPAVREVWRPVVAADGTRTLVLHAEVAVARHGRRWSTKWSIAKWGRQEARRRARACAEAYLAQAAQVRPRPRRCRRLVALTCEECGGRFQTRRPEVARTCSAACRYRRWSLRHRTAGTGEAA